MIMVTTWIQTKKLRRTYLMKSIQVMTMMTQKVKKINLRNKRIQTMALRKVNQRRKKLKKKSHLIRRKRIKKRKRLLSKLLV